MEKLSRRGLLGWLGLGGAAAAAGGTALVLSNTAKAEPTTALQSIGLDWRKEGDRVRQEKQEQQDQARMQEALDAAAYDPVEDALLVLTALYARLTVEGMTFAPAPVTMPFASMPLSCYLRAPFEEAEEARLKLQLDWLLRGVLNGHYAPLIRLTQRFYEEHKRQDVVRKPRLTKTDFASRHWSPKLLIDIDELTCSRLAYAVMIMGTAPVLAFQIRYDEAQAVCLKTRGRPGMVKHIYDTELKVMVKAEGPLLELAAYNEMAGQLE